MASTTFSDVFVPQVATQVATAQFANELALGIAGAPFVAPFPSVDAIGQEGSTVSFPRWDALGEFAALTEDVAMTPEAMATSTDTAVVQVAGKAVEITDLASLAARGDPSSEAGMQFAALAARYVDAALVTEAETTALVATPVAAVISWDAIVDCLVTNWGDRAFRDFGGLVIHSKQYGDLLKDSAFQSIAAFGEPTLATGMIGKVAGYPVYVSDRITVDAVPTPDEYDAIILKKGALGLKFQRQLLVEKDRDILKKNWVLAADVRFAVHLMYGVPSPVIIFATQ